MEIGYFDISFAIAYIMLAVFIPVLIFRLLRAFPYYVKNGDLGDNDRQIMYADWHDPWRVLIDLFTYPNPSAVLGDFAALTGIGMGLWMAWPLVPILVVGWLVYKAITTAAIKARERYLNKQKFVAKLKGDNV